MTARACTAQEDDTHKPRGLWLSAEDDTPESHGWKDWCEGEAFWLDNLKWRTEITLHPDANVLRLATAQEIVAFSDRYCDLPYPLHDWVNWPRVVPLYQGIIIAPYQWRLRLEHGMIWYYGWDCASGCIWDLAAIDSVSAPEAVTVRVRQEEEEEV